MVYTYLWIRIQERGTYSNELLSGQGHSRQMTIAQEHGFQPKSSVDSGNTLCASTWPISTWEEGYSYPRAVDDDYEISCKVHLSHDIIESSSIWAHHYWLNWSMLSCAPKCEILAQDEVPQHLASAGISAYQGLGALVRTSQIFGLQTSCTYLQINAFITFAQVVQ